jgi:predicted nucleic acid-binding Zn ribbon protein
LADLVDRWPEAVGEAIARHAWPARLGRDGRLHVATADSIWAFELGQRGAEIAARLGVSGVRFAPGPVPRSGSSPRRRRAASPTAEQRVEAAALVAAIGDENLRKSVQKAVLFSLVRQAESRSL